MQKFDIIVVGAGHAGVEAALACAKLGKNTLLFTMNLDGIANLPCNPSIGGTAKGHLVREVDALGGFMGIAADNTMIQSRMLNRGKGAAVQSLRNQTDRNAYHLFAKKALENQDKLEIFQGEIVSLLIEAGQVRGVNTAFGDSIYSNAVILATGTYLNADIHIGKIHYPSGPDNSRAASGLAQYLNDIGFKTKRFKTGTPARVKKGSIDYSQLILQKGDENILPFSFMTEWKLKNVCECYIAYTNTITHKIIQNNIEKSAIYSGNIMGVGPRYCPSIEDKIVRFPDKERHQIFVEPCGLNTQEMYLQGMSSSLPIEVQIEMYRSIKGFQNLEIMRPAYAIEYDCLDPTELKLTLGSKECLGLYTAGQLNGTSGYEEAAAQGLVAGINAVKYCNNELEITLQRSGSYIGTLIDDIVTKGVLDPYRMMTSRSEYRLLLRQDNADERLTPIGREVGLVDDNRWKKFIIKQEIKEQEMKRLQKNICKGNVLNKLLFMRGYPEAEGGISAAILLKRPGIEYTDIEDLIGKNIDVDGPTAESIEAEIKYEGYIQKQLEQVKAAAKKEEMQIPMGFDYKNLQGMRLEAREKLAQIGPKTLGQAGRIPGVTPNDIDQLTIYIRLNEEKIRK